MNVLLLAFVSKSTPPKLVIFITLKTKHFAPMLIYIFSNSSTYCIHVHTIIGKSSMLNIFRIPIAARKMNVRTFFNKKFLQRRMPNRDFLLRAVHT